MESQFTIENGSIYNNHGHIIEDVSFIITLDKEDSSSATLYKIGEHDDIVNNSLPKINVLKDIMHIVCFTFGDTHLNKTALSKEDQVKIINHIRRPTNQLQIANIAHAIHTNNIDELKQVFDDILKKT